MPHVENIVGIIPGQGRYQSRANTCNMPMMVGEKGSVGLLT
jgi:hypothetical protein